MANKTPPARTTTLHNPAGSLLASSEATALAAGDTVLIQNNGNTVAHFKITTAGTGTVVAINSANNQAITLALGDVLAGPWDPAVFGSTVTITTAAAIGSVGLYTTTQRFRNAAANPFELNATAPDAS